MIYAFIHTEYVDGESVELQEMEGVNTIEEAIQSFKEDFMVDVNEYCGWVSSAKEKLEIHELRTAETNYKKIAFLEVQDYKELDIDPMIKEITVKLQKEADLEHTKKRRFEK